MIVFENPLPYDIRINGSANKGFILSAGCCTCVFTELEDMLDAIRDYVKDPKGMEDKYNEAMRHARPQVVESAPERDMGRGNSLAVPEPMNEAMEDTGCDRRR